MKFYLIDKPKMKTLEDRLRGIRSIQEEGFVTGDAVRCPQCNRFLSMLEWLPPHRIELERWGKEYGDFANIGGRDMIVSERFAQAFQQSGLNGLCSFEQVEVVKVIHRLGKPKQPLPHYFKAEITRSTTTIDQQASGYVWADESKVCPVCLWDTLIRHEGLVIKEGTWNGDDIFYPRGGTGPLVSERFKAFCEKHDFLDIIFEPAEETSYENSLGRTQG